VTIVAHENVSILPATFRNRGAAGPP
jgi:hypothetical protein